MFVFNQVIHQYNMRRTNSIRIQAFARGFLVRLRIERRKRYAMQKVVFRSLLLGTTIPRDNIRRVLEFI